MTISFYRSLTPDVTPAAALNAGTPADEDPATPAEIALGGFQMIGFDWRYLYVNPMAAGHRRKTPQEMVGRTMQEVHPGIEATPVFRELQRCMKERCVSTIETQFQFADGARQWFEVRIQPTPEGICMYTVDIQARKTRD